MASTLTSQNQTFIWGDETLGSFQLPCHLLNTPLLSADLSAPSSVVLSGWFFPPLFIFFFLSFLACGFTWFLSIRAEGITPSYSLTTSLSFAVLDLCTRPSPLLPICPLSSFPEMEPLLVTCSAFTGISSFPPCSQKTCKDLFSLPAFLPLTACILDIAQRWLCHRGEKGKTEFSMSGSQQYKHGSVGVKQHGE